MPYLQERHTQNCDGPRCRAHRVRVRRWWGSVRVKLSTREMAKNVLAEADAIMSGHARRFWNGAHALPAWNTLNQLAHSDVMTLRTLADRPVRWKDWDGVTSSLAADIVTLAGNQPDAMLRLQRVCIIPLELRLLACGRSTRGWGPAYVLEACRTRLQSVPSHCERPEP